MLRETDAGRSASVGSEEPGHLGGREAGGRTRRALLVDDHDIFRQVLAILLERRVGIDENLQANSVAEARAIVDVHDDLLHLAVVDLDLPGGDVSELIGELHGRNIPVLAITASGNPNRSVGSSEADEVLTTRTSSDDILGAARRLIDE